MSTLIWLDDSELWFPPIDEAQSDPDGLLAVGGDLSIDRLLLAYASGIFPWFEDDQPFLWWSPSTRTVIQPGSFEASKSLKKKLRKLLPKALKFLVHVECVKSGSKKQLLLRE